MAITLPNGVKTYEATDNVTMQAFNDNFTVIDGKIGTLTSQKAPLASPAFTGTPTAPTPATADNSTALATTAWVKLQGYLTSFTSPVSSVNSKTGAVVITATDVGLGNVTNESKATMFANAALTGTSTAPTAVADTNTTQLATTAFVLGQGGTITPLINGVAAVGTSKKYAREDHVHPTDTTRAPLASPAFTGTPTVPTAGAGTNSTQAASTAFVVTAIAGKADLASPALTGAPTTPTATAGLRTTQIASLAFVGGEVDAAVANLQANTKDDIISWMEVF
jgi:hypothetical protein